jgi:hypothetical protein
VTASVEGSPEAAEALRQQPTDGQVDEATD